LTLPGGQPSVAHRNRRGGNTATARFTITVRASVSLTSEEYEAVRRWPNHFFVKPGHIFPEVERIVDYAGKDGTRYEVVEKFGEGGKVAVELDQRRASSG
jgi:hypothetical protein